MADTVTQLLQARADDDTTAIRFDGETWTWREYIASAKRQAATVIGLADPSRAMHVGVLLPNTPAMLTSLAASALGGYVTVGINNTRRGEALAADINRADCQLLLADPTQMPLIHGLDLPGVRVIDVESDEWRELLVTSGELVPHSVPTAMDTFMLIFTSGTSGNPKPVQLAHMMVPFAGPVLVEKYEITSDDVCYLSMPLFHSAAILGGYCVALCSGASMAPATFSATRFLDDVRRYGVTYMNYVGRPLSYILATPEQPDDADNPLRVAFGNEATDRDIDDFGRRFGCTVNDAFGSTELAIIITRESGTPAGSIGKGYPGVAIFNSTTGRECAPAEFDENGALANPDEAIGEIVNTQGAGLFVGYYNDVDATAERVRDGKYWSGDLGYRDADEWIYLAGRAGDWMRVDGENIAAGPIERILMREPKISRVAVYGVPDDHVGDALMAAIVLRDNEVLTRDDLVAFLEGQADLSPKAWPSYVRIDEDLPSTATNKILKRELKAQGVTGPTLWRREPRSRMYRAVT
ncbi:long-chain fatty-acid--CoA ligase FadD17 [Gordonia effusa NBRC 100432]|uniref:Long-chain fatty-acid--CoA ligase FadD17 n=1 Tax=Gordonia effusa NBRC 100432 TaxID=1077974 RepID=H0QX69_9ACTN|nr:fatty-acid--CoA ligase FadD1 [Gordonia effusa]GAB17420.1 long-chain fatty-acid--CoA ligase FadD17 [Gordonia effusa NBRC 100432]